MDLYKLFYPNSEIVQLVYNVSNIDSTYKMHITANRLGHPYTVFNHVFERQLFGKDISKLSGHFSLTHITSHRIGPVVRDGRVVVTIHDLIDFRERLPTVSERMLQYLIKRNLRVYSGYENIITLTEKVKRDIMKIFNISGEKVKVIPNFVSDYFYYMEKKEDLRRKLGLPVDKKLILSVSSSAPRKNLKMVEDVVGKLGQGFQLVRIGPAIGGSITFNGIPPETVNLLYNACDVLLFPTLDEGFGYPIIEAFKTGLPVVSSNIDVIREVAGDAALLVNPMDIEENVEGVRKAVENSTYYASKGYERVKLYSKERIRKMLTDYYEKIIG
jgi:glycosyltransferase involved in cell wall biosynthesis